MYEALFHPAIWMPAILAIAGIILFVVGNNRVHGPTRFAGIGVLCAAVLWFAAASVVKTPVEQAVERTQQIIDAVETADWTKLATLLDNNTSINVPRYQFRGGQAIADGAQMAAEQYRLTQIRILNTDVLVTPPTHDIRVTINTLLEGGQPTTGRFEFIYERRSDGLLLSEIRPLQVGPLNFESTQ